MASIKHFIAEVVFTGEHRMHTSTDIMESTE